MSPKGDMGDAFRRIPQTPYWHGSRAEIARSRLALTCSKVARAYTRVNARARTCNKNFQQFQHFQQVFNIKMHKEIRHNDEHSTIQQVFQQNFQQHFKTINNGTTLKFSTIQIFNSTYYYSYNKLYNNTASTRTALIRNGLAELRLSSARQGAKAPFKTEEQNRVTREDYNFITKQQNNRKSC